ncbi:hypothetical protein BOX15_Mlig017754g1 [Macrostomum lignano]|uniref:Ubiquitin-like domain-containing protein n=1 Tax=Macrostomum lignano TaxID=282301 RepID=A0A267GG01_9PLAT|nr:hypothetical protein BOX15_Mlig017754g3 [Macrostomum lignano]PAA84486.1 hypothetical protein BOX15_Mlig017754g2 [Macrostomum lignano]PAA84968.1 hypothetical protein BOX15_Mlig017754g1 [Macrostomum lignano]
MAEKNSVVEIRVLLASSNKQLLTMNVPTSMTIIELKEDIKKRVSGKLVINNLMYKSVVPMLDIRQISDYLKYSPGTNSIDVTVHGHQETE